MKFYANGDVPEQPSMYFIFGAGGTGKTTIAKQLPGKKAHFSFDLTTNPLKGDKDIDVFIIEESDIPTIQATIDKWVVGALRSDKYQTIILDNVSALQNFVLENIDNKSKDGRQNYQKMQLWFRELGMHLRNSGKTIYATAHEVDNGSSGLDSKGRYAPDMNKTTFNAFTSMFDLVGHIYLEKGQRMIDLDPEIGNFAKNRLDDRKLIKASELVNTKENGEIKND